MKTNPLVSIVIPTYNSEKTLVKCLESIKNQTYQNIEVIIVDKYSIGKTIEIAKNYGVKVIQGYFNKPEARNVGILNSNGEYVFVADSDFIFESTLVEEALKRFIEESCDAIFVPEEYFDNSFLKRCRTLEKKMHQGAEAIEAPRIYKKWVFSKVLFDERNQGPDEFDFYLDVKRLGIKTSRVKSKILLAESPLNFRKKFSHGKYFVYYARKHKKEEIIRKQTSFDYRVGLILKAFGYSKLEALGLTLLKTLEFFFFTLGRFTGLFDRTIQRLSVDVREEFDAVGENYEVSMYGGSLGNKFVGKIEKDVILSLLKQIFVAEKIMVLDVGAGTGRWSREFLRLGYDVTALDISKKMCEYLESKLGELKVVCGNIESAILNDKYDLIFSFRSFKYTVNRKRALENVRNSLKSGGYAIVEMPNKFNPFYFVPRVVTPVLYALTRKKISKIFLLADFVSEKEFKKELEKLGFNVVKTKRFFFFPHKIYSKINSEYLIRFIYGLDKTFSRFFPRSIVYVCVNDGDKP
ncbi:MAG: glycosyltransferase [Dehalococcoidia bacterium]|nr:MAG: glycosyltransferase [Dehalococcoidia bacterium]